MKVDFSLPVLCAAECPRCELCEEPYCVVCGEHYADCAHPGPDSDPDDEEE